MNLKGTASKVGITVSFALFTVVCDILPNWTWWDFGNAYVAVAIADTLIAWSLTGLVLAKMIQHQADLADESEPESVKSNESQHPLHNAIMQHALVLCDSSSSTGHSSETHTQDPSTTKSIPASRNLQAVGLPCLA